MKGEFFYLWVSRDLTFIIFSCKTSEQGRDRFLTTGEWDSTELKIFFVEHFPDSFFLRNIQLYEGTRWTEVVYLWIWPWNKIYFRVLFKGAWWKFVTFISMWKYVCARVWFVFYRFCVLFCWLFFFYFCSALLSKNNKNLFSVFVLDTTFWITNTKWEPPLGGSVFITFSRSEEN